ncbi:uncharacterized protein LOC125179367 [Hyalella azteca]|uniref:Uncharacterized protein LOC125179367 n=1 Tax=Hyalella azteca TaxID=294128 RepID=A0A979FV06_HYAAZ|nr:uncharacterized protein LOC125179367 [Hyalella azteca]
MAVMDHSSVNSALQTHKQMRWLHREPQDEYTLNSPSMCPTYELQVELDQMSAGLEQLHLHQLELEAKLEALRQQGSQLDQLLATLQTAVLAASSAISSRDVHVEQS